MLILIVPISAQRFWFLGENAASDLISRLQLADCQPDLLHGLLALAFNQALAQQIQLIFRLRLFRGGQQHLGLNQHQVGGHGDKLAGNLHIQPLHLVQIGQILLQYGRDGHILNLNPILTQQQENNVQRAFKVLHLLAAGVDNALQTVLRFFHRRSLLIFAYT